MKWMMVWNTAVLGEAVDHVTVQHLSTRQVTCWVLDLRSEDYIRLLLGSVYVDQKVACIIHDLMIQREMSF